MTLHPVIVPVHQEAVRRTSQQVKHQRAASRTALDLCARMSNAPRTGWSKDRHGAPLPNEGFHWSVSHTVLWAAAVVADERVGIDIESLTPRDRPLHDLLAGREEWSLLQDRSWPAFFRLWTAKEAVLKANGVGIGKLMECGLVAIGDEEHMTLEFAHNTWCVEHYRHADHIAALACLTVTAQWHVIQEPP